MTIGNPQLAAPAYESLVLSMVYIWPQGWAVRCTGRRSGSTTWEHSSYPDLVTEELLDVVIHDLELKLGV